MLQNKIFQKSGIIITGIVSILGCYYLYTKYKTPNNDKKLKIDVSGESDSEPSQQGPDEESDTLS
jgi:hypothetical protein